MGQKVNHHGLRVGVKKDWDSRLYAKQRYDDGLVKDFYNSTYSKKNT